MEHPKQLWRGWACIPLLLAVQAAAVAAPAPLVDVPLVRHGGYAQPTVLVNLPGHDAVPCIVDTGSDRSVLPGSLLADAERAGRMHVRFYNRAELLVSYRVPYLYIGGVRLEAVDVARRDTAVGNAEMPMPCVLGANVWGKFTMDLDGPAQRLRLFARGTRLASILDGRDGGASLESVRAGQIRTTAWIGDVRAEAFLDTGWYRTTANETLLDALHVDVNDPHLRTTQIRIVGGTQTYSFFDVPAVRLGTLVLDDVGINVGERNLPVIRRERRAYLHLGIDVIGRERLLVDLAHHEAVLAPSASR